MRLARLLAVVLPLAFSSAGCLRLLDPDYECVNECFIGQTACADDLTTEFCMIEPFFGCMVWMTDQDCGARNGVCIDGECTCSWGFVACGENGPCTDIWHDPANCGGCGLACGSAEICVDGVCVR